MDEFGWLNSIIGAERLKQANCAERTGRLWAEAAGLTVDPTIFGPAAAAWHADTAKRQEPVLADWIIHAPLAHPFWHNYWLLVTHLRDVPGKSRAVLYRPDATHEIILYAINPSYGPSLEGFPHLLSPPNIIGQLHSHTDHSATDFAKGLIQSICRGALSPDTDFRRAWSAYLTLAPGSL